MASQLKDDCRYMSEPGQDQINLPSQNIDLRAIINGYYFKPLYFGLVCYAAFL